MCAEIMDKLGLDGLIGISHFPSRCECYDYLFEIAVKMKSHGLDPEAVPSC